MAKLAPALSGLKRKRTTEPKRSLLFDTEGTSSPSTADDSGDLGTAAGGVEDSWLERLVGAKLEDDRSAFRHMCDETRRSSALSMAKSTTAALKETKSRAIAKTEELAIQNKEHIVPLSAEIKKMHARMRSEATMQQDRLEAGNTTFDALVAKFLTAMQSEVDKRILCV